MRRTTLTFAAAALLAALSLPVMKVTSLCSHDDGAHIELLLACNCCHGHGGESQSDQMDRNPPAHSDNHLLAAASPPGRTFQCSGASFALIESFHGSPAAIVPEALALTALNGVDPPPVFRGSAAPLLI